MSAFFIYLLKVCCWITAWWFVYLFFFRKETFYAFNRIYLMTGLAASFLLPLLTIHYPVEILLNLTSTPSVVENIQAPKHPVDVYSILFYLYVFCGAFLIVRQLFLLLKIIIRIHSSGYSTVNNCRLVDSPDTKIPFSFYKYIFLNFRQITEGERQLILAHERSHIEQRHWIDLAIAETIRILLWFNPFVWLYQRSIKENHEYLADHSVLDRGYSPVGYRAVLINQSLNLPVFSLANSFTSYKFKRIFMMKKENSNPLKKLAALLLVPAAGVFLWAFAEPEYHVTTTVEAPVQTSRVYLLSVDDSVAVEKANVHKTVVKVKAVNVSLSDTLKNETAADDLPTGENQTQINIAIRGVNSFNPLFIIDGVESSAAVLNKIKPEQIESISVLKNESATSVYGEKGENGVILITTKANSQSPTGLFNIRQGQQPIGKTMRRILRDSPPPLIIIDGEESSATIDELDPKEIESISVLKNETATSVYGDKGKNGVILITTKNKSELKNK